MINRVVNLFRRYAARHADFQRTGFSLIDSNGKRFGHIETLTVRESRLIVEGWAIASRLGLANEDQTVEKTPSWVFEEAFDAQGHAGDIKPAIVLDIPLSLKPTVIWAETDGARYTFALPPVTPGDLRRMRRSQIIPFIRDLVRAMPAALHWAIHRDALSLAQIKDALDLNTVSRSVQLNTGLFSNAGMVEDNSPAGLFTTGVSIILPVYNALDLLPEVLQRVLDHTDLPWRLIIVEDRSSDAQVRPWLREWHARLPVTIAPRVTLIENETNLGFIRSVNRAFATALPFGDHAVLLNSDAFVPANWASRLIRPMLERQDVATVTPMSNDAEIFNVPAICRREELPRGAADALDKVAARFLPGADLGDAPTGVGFCMAMNIRFLRALPELDTAFGRGYGEEVDWCQRARLMGGRHIGLGGLFVEHRGGTSFGSEEKLKLVRKNNAIVAQRYPRYDTEVQDFIRNDPMITPRLSLALAWAGIRQKGAVPVYIAHSMGGGAEHYLQDRVAKDVAADAAAVVLRVGGTSRWKLELHSAHGVTQGETDDTDFILSLLALMPARHLIYSCAVGDRDPLSLPDTLLSIASGPNDRIEMLVHDFLPLSPSYTLLGTDGTYKGVPMPDTNTDRAHTFLRADGNRASLGDWRHAWGKLMQAAYKVIVFSPNSRDIVAAAYPQAEANIAVVPHALITDVPRVHVSGAKTNVPVIGVLGNIGLQKGVVVLRDLSRLLVTRKKARLVVIGNIDTAYALASSAQIHGAYKVSDIPALVSRYGISCWLIPSVWPETFSYTTHEAIATGLPVWSFAIGAQGDAVRAAAEETGKGGTIPLDWARDDLEAILDRILAQK